MDHVQVITILIVLSALGNLLVVGIPVARVLYRTGFNPWHALWLVLPVANVIGLWVFAFGRWPIADAQTAASGNAEPLQSN